VLFLTQKQNDTPRNYQNKLSCEINEVQMHKLLTLMKPKISGCQS